MIALSCRLLAQDPEAFLLAQEPGNRTLAQDPEAFLLAQEPGNRTLAPEPEVPHVTQSRSAEGMANTGPGVNVPPEPQAAPVVVVEPDRPPALEPEINGMKSVSGFTNERFGYVLHGRAQAQYDSNIFIQPNNEQSDFIFTLTPGVAVGLGDFKGQLAGADLFRYRFERYANKNYLFLDYAPSLVAFVDHSDQNSFNQDVRLQGEYTFQKLTVGVRGAFQQFNAPSADIGTRVLASHLSAALTSRYQFSGKTDLEANFYYDDQRFENNGDDDRRAINFVDSRQFRTEEWLNFRVMPKTTASVGAVVGHLERSEGPSETYEQLQLRLRWEASSKLTLGVVAGPEFRQIQGGDSVVNGVFALHASWAATERASFNLQAYRDVQPSGAIGEDIIATGVKLAYRQRLLERYYFDLSGGYERGDYRGNQDLGKRHDDFTFVRSALGLGLNRWLTASLVGEYRDNRSSVAERSFEETRATMVFDVLF